MHDAPVISFFFLICSTSNVYIERSYFCLLNLCSLGLQQSNLTIILSLAFERQALALLCYISCFSRDTLEFSSTFWVVTWATRRGIKTVLILFLVLMLISMRACLLMK